MTPVPPSKVVPAIVATSDWIQGLAEIPLALSNITLPGNGEDEIQTSVGNTAELSSNKNPAKRPTKENFYLPKSEEELAMFVSRLVQCGLTKSEAEQAVASR